MNEGKKTYEASAAIEPYRVLQLAAGKVLHNTAAATTVVLGFSEYPVASGDDIAVMMSNLPGSREVMAAGAIAAGAKCYAAAAGMVSALPVVSGTYRLIGTALEAAADGEVFEIMPAATMETVTVHAYEASGAIVANRVLQIAAGKILHMVADPTKVVIGFSDGAAEIGADLAVDINPAGPRLLTAGGVIAEGAAVYAGAAGKVTALPAAAATYRLIGTALEAAAADDDLLLVLPVSSLETTVVSP